MREARDAARDAARQRHPSAWWHPDHDRLRRLIAEQLAATGHRSPVLAATVVAVRGVLRMDRSEFAAVLGVPVEEVAALEDGAAVDDDEDEQQPRARPKKVFLPRNPTDEDRAAFVEALKAMPRAAGDRSDDDR